MRGERAEISGQTFGRLTVLGRAPQQGPRKRRWWHCRCRCGNHTIVDTGSLRKGNTKSCGCLSRETAADNARRNSTTHGETRTPLHRTWLSMHQRCRDPNGKSWKRYGGRGITVCDRWSDFLAFKADVGERPSPDHSLERIDNDLGYFPENVRWATRKEQCNNKSNNLWVRYRGVEMKLHEAVAAAGGRVTVDTARHRIKEERWPIAAALETPAWRKRKDHYLSWHLQRELIFLLLVMSKAI